MSEPVTIKSIDHLEPHRNRGDASPVDMWPFELRAGPFVANPLVIRKLAGKEAISKPFWFEVEVSVHGAYGLASSLLLGQTASLSWAVADRVPRMISGIVTLVSLLGTEPLDATATRLLVRIEPRLSRLGLRKRSRIFQGVTARDVIDAVLAEAKIPCRWMLTRALRSRPFVVQYNETDLEFVTRLLASEGVYFTFDHPSGYLEALSGGAAGAVAGFVATSATIFGASGAVGATVSDAEALLDKLGLYDTVVFGDGADYPGIGENVVQVAAGLMDQLPSAEGLAFLSGTGTFSGLAKPPLPSLMFREASGLLPEEDHVHEARLDRRMKTKSVTLSGHDWASSNEQLGTASTKLASLRSDVLAAVLSPEGALSAALELDIDTRALGYGQELGMYAHGPRDTSEAPNERAKRVLGAKRARALRLHGKSGARRMSAGCVFALTDHAVSGMNGKWVLERVTHEADMDGLEDNPELIYRNTFRCLPASTVARPKPKPPCIRATTERAVVVGAGSGEPLTDELGRVKVRFAWEPGDAQGTCFVPVLQHWAGHSLGFFRLPRAGSEVLVDFCFGDETVPVVVGCIPNEKTPPVRQLPEASNELYVRTRVRDSVGHEFVMRNDAASPELRFVAKGAFTREIQGRELVQVGQPSTSGDDLEAQIDSLEVFGSAETRIEGNATSIVRGDRRSVVLGDRHTSVAADLTLAVGDAWEAVVRGPASVCVGEQASRYIAGNLVERIGTRDQWSVGGNRSVQIGATRALSAVTSITETGGAMARAATETLDLSSLDSLRLECGSSFVDFTQEEIVLSADTIALGDAELCAELSAQVSESALRLEDKKISLAPTEEWVAAADKSFKVASGSAVVSMDPSSLSIVAADVCLSGGEAIVRLGTHADLKGKSIDINGANASGNGETVSAETEEAPKQRVDVALVDDKGGPVGGARYIISVGETLYEGALDAAGKAVRWVVEGSPTIAFPDHDSKGWATGQAEPAPDPSMSLSATVATVIDPMAPVLDSDFCWDRVKAEGFKTKIPGSSYFTWEEALNGNTAEADVPEDHRRNMVRLVRALESVRTQFGKPFFVNSWYRSARQNKACGGAKKSSHLQGLAIDFRVIKESGHTESAIKASSDFRQWLSTSKIFPGRWEQRMHWVHLDVGNLVNGGTPGPFKGGGSCKKCPVSSGF